MSRRFILYDTFLGGADASLAGGANGCTGLFSGFSFLFILLSCSSARCELAQWCAIRSAEEVSSGGGDASAPGCQCFDSLVSVLHSLRLFLHSPVYGRILMTKDLTGHRPHSELYTVLDAQVLLRSALSTSPDTTAAAERKNTELHILSLYAWLSVRFYLFFFKSYMKSDQITVNLTTSIGTKDTQLPFSSEMMLSWKLK